MHVIQVRNVQQALPLGLALLAQQGVNQTSRNGAVLVANAPVVTVYERPVERVLFWAQRDANPFFHLNEGLWMLAGRDDAAFVAKYVKRMAGYSDDGKTLWGAYGKRWRDWFPSDVVPHQDQLDRVIAALKASPEDRRQVITMWDGSRDPARAAAGGKDVPCNTQCYAIQDTEGRLQLTITCRSNDAIWGAHGANAVHFSMMQEYLAAGLGWPVGRLFQVSNNYHVYEEPAKQCGPILQDTMYDPYADGSVAAMPMFNTDLGTWNQDLRMFLDDPTMVGLRDPWFRRVACPIEMAHRHYAKNKGEDRYLGALEILERCAASDWRRACEEWINRRYAAWQRASDDGANAV